MSKQLQLIHVLLKCGRIGKSEKNSSAVGDSAVLIRMIVGVALVVGMFLGGQYAAEHTQKLGSWQDVFATILTMAGLAAFFLTFMNAMNQLYISSELDVLVTFPFTPLQIVTAKLVSVSVFPVTLCLGFAAPAAVGYFTKASGLSPLFIPAMIIGGFLLAVYVVAVVSVLLMIIMRTFHFIRSRNVISIVSALMVFVLTMAYVSFVSNGQEMNEEQAVGIFVAIRGMSQGLSLALPTIGFTVSAAGGEALQLLIAVGITAGVLAVLIVCTKYLYFSAALGMTDANGARGPMSASKLDKYTAGASVQKTLLRRELRQILRTPALITNGYLFSIVVPFVIVIPVAVQIIKEINEQLAEQGLTLTLDAVRQLINPAAVPATLDVMFGSLIGLFFASMAVAFSSLSRFCISHEGKDFASLKTMPISARVLVTVKRRAVLVFNGISGWFLPSLAFIAIGVLGLVPVWTAVVCAAASLAWLLTLVDFCMLMDVKKPNLNWENEGDVTKNNIPGVIIFFIALAAVIGICILYFGVLADVPSVDLIFACGLVALPAALAVIFELRLRKAADRLF